jgi:hypothetical protein
MFLRNDRFVVRGIAHVSGSRARVDVNRWPGPSAIMANTVCRIDLT